MVKTIESSWSANDLQRQCFCRYVFNNLIQRNFPNLISDLQKPLALTAVFRSNAQECFFYARDKELWIMNKSELIDMTPVVPTTNEVIFHVQI